MADGVLSQPHQGHQGRRRPSAGQRPRRLIVADVSREDAAELDGVLAEVLDRGISGLITINSSLNRQLRERLLADGRRVVSIMFEDPLPPVVCSVVSDHAAFGELVHHVVSRHKCSCAVLITLPVLNPLKRNIVDLARNEKREMFRTAVEAAGLAVETPRAVLPTRTALASLRGLPRSLRSRPTILGEAVFEKLAHRRARHRSLLSR